MNIQECTNKQLIDELTSREHVIRVRGIASEEKYAQVYVNLEGQFHRTDGPAVTRPNGDKEWWIDGMLHRTNGPAIQGHEGDYWYQNDKLHRTDGPALVLNDGTKQYWLNGRKVNKEEVTGK